MSQPLLVEPGARYFFQETLKNCRNIKTERSGIIFNTVAFIGLSVLTVTFLWYKKRNKLSQEEVKQREIEQHKYIEEQMEKVKLSQRQDDMDDMITNLPKY